MRRTFLPAVGLACAVALLGGCADGTTPTIKPGGDRSARGLQVGQGVRLVPPTGTQTGSVVEATWRLGAAALAAGTDEAGTVVSPSSLVVALSMLADGSTGSGLATLDGVLGAPSDARRTAVATLRGSLEAYDGDPELVQGKELPDRPLVHQASQAVVQEGYAAAEPFLDTLWQTYGAGLLVADLRTEKGMAPLHAWVKKHTGGLIERSGLTPKGNAVLALQDAVVLAAAWGIPFDEAGLSAPFRTAGGAEVDVATMRRTAEAAYVELDGWRAVRLTYRTADGPGLVSDILLPPAEQVGPVDGATFAMLASALDDADERMVTLTMPKVDLTSKVDLIPALTQVGLGHLFTPGTSGLDAMLVESGPLVVDQVAQQAVLTMEEDGTRAAAVTEVMVVESALPVGEIDLTVDRPFYVTVADATTGWPLFLAYVTDPSAG